MDRRLFVSIFCLSLVAALMYLSPAAAIGQAKASVRTPDGQPDLQGTWSWATITPFERPAEFAGKEFLTEQEAAKYEKDILERNNMDRRDGSAEQDVGRAYNDFWWDRGTHIVKTSAATGALPCLAGRRTANHADRVQQQYPDRAKFELRFYSH